MRSGYELFSRVISQFDRDMRFSKTHVVTLVSGKYFSGCPACIRGDFHVDGRSLTGVEEIGQAFADEIFRVFRSEYPDITIISARAEPNVRKMIDRAMLGSDDGKQGTLFP